MCAPMRRPLPSRCRLLNSNGFRKQHPHAGERIMRNLAQLLADRLILANAKVNLLTSG